MLFFAGTLIWYLTHAHTHAGTHKHTHTHTHTHTQRHTEHCGANRLTHSYKYILTPPVMSSQ